MAGAVLSATKEEWKQRSVYQVLTDRFARTDGGREPCTELSKYCGGTFKGLTQHLDYIQSMGFDAIWISPVVENSANGYHGYWASNFEAINPEFGTEQDLQNLVDAAHQRDMFVMVDVVANHVSYVPQISVTDAATSSVTRHEDFSSIHPFNDPSYYHENCEIKDWDDEKQMENCRLCGLPDLDQDHPFVRQYLKDWV